MGGNGHLTNGHLMLGPEHAVKFYALCSVVMH